MNKLITTRTQTRQSTDDPFYENTEEQTLYYKTSFIDMGILISDTTSISEDQMVSSRTWVWDTSIIPSTFLKEFVYNDPIIIQYAKEADDHCARYNITRSGISWVVSDDNDNVLAQGSFEVAV